MRAVAPSVYASDEMPGAGMKIGKRIVNQFLVNGVTGYAVFSVSADGRVMSWNSGAQKTFGYREAAIVGRPLQTLFTPEDVAAGEPARELATALNGTQIQHDRWHVREDGTRFWGTNTVEPIFERSGKLLGFVKLIRDVTPAYEAAQAIADSEQRLRMLVDSVRDTAIFAMGLDGTISSWNPGAEAIFGFADDEIVGRPLSALFGADDSLAGYAAGELEKTALGGTANVERWFARSDGSRFLGAGKISQLKLGAENEPRGFVAVLHDVTAQHAIAEDLRRRAQFDELTDLPNRRTFNEHLQRAIGLMRRRVSTVFAVLFIDVDHFKAVNDRYGHMVADRLLTVTARRLERCIRSGDIAARLGGDEFAILLNAISGVTDATEAAERIGALMGEPVDMDGAQVSGTVSIGIAMGIPEYERAEDVLRDADAAMYEAKVAGRGRSAIFDSRSRTAAAGLTENLRAALDRNELRVFYQPIVALGDGHVTGFEALMRWDHPRFGLLLPAAFIPLAEQSDMIFALDRWVLQESCRQLAAWRANGVDPKLTVSVNVSGRDFSRSNFLPELRRILDSTNLPARNLRLEMTESVIVEQSERARSMLAAIRDVGVLLDVDDFGTGFSSLGTLQYTEVDGLKIDSSFVSRIGVRTGAALVETVIVLARKLAIEVIAEGIETPEQAQRLVQLGCGLGQGALFSLPLEAELARRFAVAHNRFEAS
jgi:diguanylate cyclase (GGDEF)-like protein/PAS domain S-box-containing protein